MEVTNNNQSNLHVNKDVMVSLEELETMSGVPTEFIKKELMLDESVSIDDLRSKMLKFLDTTFEENGLDVNQVK